MKKTHFVIINKSGEILGYDLPFELSDGCQVSELLPIYTFSESYEYLLDLEIDAYEFEYQGNQYIGDTVLFERGNEFIAYLDIKTSYYSNLAKNQTLANTKKIELEYARLNQKFLVSKNKYLEFVITRMTEMLDNSLGLIDKSVSTLSGVNTYVKEDESIIAETMGLVQDEIKFIKQTMSHMAIFKHLDPSTLLDQPEFIPLKNFIVEISEDIESTNSVVINQIPESAILYGNRGFFTKLLKYYLNDNMLEENDIEFACKTEKENLLELNINYFANIKGFMKPQRFSQNILLPASFEIESNPDLIQQIFDNIKNVLLNQAKILYEVAA